MFPPKSALFSENDGKCDVTVFHSQLGETEISVLMI